MKATIDISKAKLKNSLFMEIDYRKDFEDKHRNIVNEECNAPVHEDLKLAFQKLHPHLAIMTEYIDEGTVPEDIEHFEHPSLESFKVTQISIGSDGDGVTITGQKKLKSGKVLNLNAPYTKYYEEGGYRFGADLQIAISNVIAEVEQYMDGKVGEGAQLELEMGSDDSENEM